MIRWSIFKDGDHWVVARRHEVWFRTHTGAEAIAVFNKPALRTKIGW